MEGGFAKEHTEEGKEQRRVMFRERFGTGPFFEAGPKRAVTEVAIEEMLHLTLVINLLTAITCEPLNDTLYFKRENFPLDPCYLRDRFGYNTEIEEGEKQAWMGLWTFGLDAMRGWEWFEAFAPKGFKGPMYLGDEDHLCETPTPNDVRFLKGLEQTNASTLVELYEVIALGFVKLEDELGEDKLFCGSEEFQVDYAQREGPDVQERPIEDQGEGPLFPFPRRLLKPITNVMGAIEAINTIVVQGEGDVEEWNDFIVDQLDMDPALFEDPDDDDLSLIHI